MPRMWSLAMDSQDTGMSGSLGGRVGPEDLEELTARLHLIEDGPDIIGVAVSFEVDEVHVFPRAPLGRSRFDLGQVESPGRERLENAVEHARLVLHGKEDGRLVTSRWSHGSPAYDQEAGAVGGVVFDAPPQHGHAIGAGGQLRGQAATGGTALPQPGQPKGAGGQLGGTAATVGSSLARSAAAVVEDISSRRASGRWASSHWRVWARPCGWEHTTLISSSSVARERRCWMMSRVR